jgi:diamine N-acetyltransferase
MGNILNGVFVNLRQLTVQDAEITLTWRKSQRAKFLNTGSQTLEQQINWISIRPASELNFIIELKNGNPVGMLSLVGIDKQNFHAEPARFIIGNEEAVKGIPVAAEAIKLIYGLAFDELNMKRLWGVVAEENSLMLKWHKYLGMKEEGRMRKHLCLSGVFQDAIIIGLLEDDYRNKTLPRINGLIYSCKNV